MPRGGSISRSAHKTTPVLMHPTLVAPESYRCALQGQSCIQHVKIPCLQIQCAFQKYYHRHLAHCVMARHTLPYHVVGSASSVMSHGLIMLDVKSASAGLTILDFLINLYPTYGTR